MLIANLGIILICALPTFALSLILLTGSPRHRYHLPLFWMMFWSSIWMLSIAMVYLLRNPVWSEIFLRICFLASGFIFPSFAHFITVFPLQERNRWSRWAFLFYLPAIAITPFILNGQVATLTDPIQTLIAYGSMRILFKLNTLFFLSFSIGALIFKLKTATGKTKLQLKYLALVFSIATIAAVSTNLILPQLNFLHIRANMMGPFVGMILVYGIFYIINRHSFLNLQIVLRKGLIYSVLLTVYSIGYAGLIGYSQSLINPWLKSITILALILSYRLIYRGVEQFLDKYIFKSQTEYRQKLKELSQMLLMINDRMELLEKLKSTLETTLQPRHIKVILQDQGTFLIRTTKKFKIVPVNLRQTVSAIFDLHRVHRLESTTENLTIPLRIQGKTRGLVFLGPRKNHLTYSKSDREFLVTLLNHTALALEKINTIEQAKESANQLYQAQNLTNLGKLMASIAHEIKNPLTSLQFGLENIQSYAEDPKIILDLSQGLINVSSDLNQRLISMLNMTKNKSFHPQQITFQSLIQDILFLITKEARQKKIKIITQYKPELICFADPQKLKQILMNLGLNAIEAMSEGGHLIIGAFPTPQGTTFFVKDTGPGLQNNVKQSLFRPFTTTKSNGFGLGLAITKGLVDLHQGTININEKTKQGTEFIIHIPHKKEGANYE